MFDKNYPKRKDHRKKFYGAKSIDRTCRNHGSSFSSLDNRMYSTKKRLLQFKISLEE